MTPRLQDLPPEQQAKIRALVEQAPPISDRQRERLQLLFRGGEPEAGRRWRSPNEHRGSRSRRKRRRRDP